MSTRLLWLLAAVLAGYLLEASPSVAEPIALPGSALAEFPFVGDEPPASIALGPEGGIWLALDEVPGRLDRMTTQGTVNGEFVLPTGPEEDVASFINSPTNVALGGNGDMWFANRGLDAERRPLIGYTTPTGVTEEFPIPSFFGANAIARGQGTTMWYTAEESLVRVTSRGDITQFRVEQEADDTRDESSMPEALTLGPEGDMWFTDLSESETGQNFVGRTTPSGHSEKWELPAAFHTPSAIAVGAEGDIWFTEWPDGIARISPPGIITEYLVPSVSGDEYGLALGPDGNMWFSEQEDALGRITPSGAVTSFGPVLADGHAPAALTSDASGHLWYSESDPLAGKANSIGRLTVPISPMNQSAPTVAGVTGVGQSLTSTSGSWLHEPSAIHYQWQVCDRAGGECHDIPGQTGSTHMLTTAEVGDTIRVLVTASNIAGAVSVASAVSSEILAPQRVPATAPTPVLPSTAKIYYDRHTRFVVIEGIMVSLAPRAGWIDVLCHGRSCPFSRQRTSVAAACRARKCSNGAAADMPTVRLKWPLGRRRLLAGSRLSVDIGVAGSTGKSFGLVVRQGRRPTFPSGCLVPNSDVAASEC
jgi:virginiamycin B lyase